jgi:PAS domain S-box-containing protein
MNQEPHKKYHGPLRRLLLQGFIAALLIAPVSGFALDPAKSIYQYNCRSWTRQNGLPANAVNAIAQTKDGYLWLGTSAGLVRFDGGEFKLYDVGHLTNSRSSIITSLSLSRRGGIWFGMENGSFGFFDGKNISLLGSDAYGGINLNVHKVMETEDETLWIASEIVAARLTTSNTFDLVLNTTNITARYDVAALYEDSKHRVWLGTVGHGLYYWQRGTLTKFPDAVFDNLTINCVAEDREGQIWIGTDRGLLCYDSHFQRKPFEFPWYATRALLVDKRGTLWAGTSGGGLMRFDKGTPIGFQQKDGLADDFVASLAEDDEGSLWVGTRNGLSQISDVKLPTFGKAEGLTANVNVGLSVSRSKGLWVATSEGFTYFDGIAHPYTNIGLSNSYVVEIFEARNHDLYVVDGSMNVSVVSGGHVMVTYSNNVWPSALAEDDQGMIAAVGGNFFRVGTNFFKPYEFANNQSPPVGWVFNMALSHDGSIWVAANQGICRIKNGAWQMWTTEQGLAKSRVKWICEDSDGIVWAGLETGISRLKDGKIRNISRDNGLFDNIINAIVPDDHGNLWVDSSRGFFRVSRQSMNDFADGKTDLVKCEGFNGLDDVKSAEKYQQQPSGCKTPDGRIWFPTAQGIVMIDPTNIVDNHVLPKVYLQSVRANGSELDKFTSAVVQPGSGKLEFHYAGVSYLEPLKIQYRYELEGYDKEWVEAGNRRAAFYTNLKPGVYNFEVQTRYEDGEWNIVGARSTLRLLPYFYQTFWFVAVTSSSLAIGISGIYVWRVRNFRWNQKQLQRARDQLEVKVKERTSELAERNTSLKNQIEERKRAEVELAYERDLLRTLLDNSPDYVYFKDNQSRFIKASKAQADQFGMKSAQEMVGKTDFDFFSEEHARPAFEEEQEIMRTGQPMIGKEVKKFFKDGRPVSWALTTKMPFHNKNGEIIGTFGISKDITALKQVQGEAAYERDLLRTLLDNSPDQIYFKDTQSRFIKASKAQAANFGVKDAEELVGKTDFDFFSEEHARPAFEDEQEIMRTGQPMIGKEEKESWKDGRGETWVLTNKMPLPDKDGKIIGTFGISKDITALKQAQEESIFERDLLRMLLHTSPDYIYFKDAESRFIRCSTTLARQFGFQNAEELLGKSDFDLHAEGQARQAFEDEQEIMRTGHAIIGKIEHLKSGQKEFWVLTTKMPLRNVHGEIIGTFGISKDITAMKQAEAKLFQAQKMETVGKLAGGIAHEFNSIMTAIIGQSELLLNDLPSGNPLVKNATEIRKAADRAAILTRQLLAYGRKQILQPEILDLNAILANMGTVLRHLLGRDVDLRIVPAAGLKTVKADAGQIEQVIINIVMNAADAMPNGGKLTLETSNATLDQNYLSRFPELKAGGYVMLAITDTGMGMNEEVKARIFDPFFSTKGIGQGTGLGLATCFGIIKQSGGHIAVYSEVARGATFKIYLPQVEASAKAALPRLAAPHLPHGTETILLVEDDPALREMAGTLLERLGYIVMKAADGVEALSLSHQPGRGHIDLLFTDVVMPNMSGKELSDRIRSLYPQTKILFTSAYTENAIVHQGVLDENVALLQKPYTPSALASKIREILDAKTND